VSGRFTIMCVIENGHGYYTGSGWDQNINRALLVAPSQLDGVVGTFHAKVPKTTNIYVIQNSDFDYFDGKEWQYELAGAKRYSFDAARAQVGSLDV
jgi:hypothetical protein